MPTPQHVPADALADSAFLDRVRTRWTTVILPFEVAEEASVFLSEIASIIHDPTFRGKYPVAFDVYSGIEQQAKFLALEMLTVEEIADILEHRYTFPFSFPERYQYRERLRAKLVAMPLYEEQQDVAKRLWREALERNNETLTQMSLQVGESTETGTVGNWIRAYLRSVGTEPAGRLQIESFFTGDAAVRSLSSDERMRVRDLSELYERLKRTSEMPEGLEERVPGIFNGKTVVYVDGRLEEIPKDIDELYEQFRRAFPDIFGVGTKTSVSGTRVSPQAVLDEWMARNREDGGRVYEAETAILAEIRQKHEKVREVLWDAAERRDVVRSVASLKVLAKMGALHEIFTRPDVAEVIAPYIERTFGQVARSGFAKNPNRPQYVAALIRFVLEEKLGLPEGDAALWAMPVVKLLETQDAAFGRAVYFDESAGAFRWNTELSAVVVGK